ncbi:reverse transcriptase domain-containing protein [Tanacetum coccineum]
MTYCQPLSYSFHTHGGNSSFGGTSAYHPYGGYAPHVPMSNYGPSHNGPMYPSGVPPNSYLFYAQPINPLPNSPIYPNYGPTGLFADSTGYVTPFVHWIKDYSLLDRLKMPSHVGSYDGKGPDNYLHLFKGAIHFPTTYKGLMEKTYTLIEGKEVATNGAPNDHKDGFDRFNKGFSWDNNKGKKKNQDRFSPYKWSNHGLLTNLSKSPREILTTKKVAKAFEQPPCMVGSIRSCDMSKYCHFHKDHGHETNQYRELRHHIEEAIKSGQLAYLVKGIKKGKAKASDTQLGEWKKGDKDIIPAEASILMISRESPTLKRKSMENSINGTWDITFPYVFGFDNSSDLVIIWVRISGRQVNRAYMDSDSSCDVIYEHCFLKLKPSIRALRVDSKVPLVGFLGEHSWPLGEVPIEVTVGESPYTYTETLNFVIVRSDSHHNLLLGRTAMQKIDVFAWTHADMTGVPRTIMVKGKPFNTKHRPNEYKHIEPVKQKKRGLAPEQHKAAFKEVDELTKAGILREVKYQTWVANLVMLKASFKKYTKAPVEFNCVGHDQLRVKDIEAKGILAFDATSKPKPKSEFGVPQIIITDNGKQFAEGVFPVFCQRLGIYQSFTSVYYPQANGQVEVTNRDIVKGMEQRLRKNHQGWVDELPQIL